MKLYMDFDHETINSLLKKKNQIKKKIREKTHQYNKKLLFLFKSPRFYL